MKKLIYTTLIVFGALSLSHNSFANLSVIMDQYCGCRGEPIWDSSSQAMGFKEGAEYKTCRDIVSKIYNDSIKGDSDIEKPLNNLMRKESSDKGNFVCNNSETKDFLDKFRQAQKATENNLEDQVDQKICGSLDVNKLHPLKVRKCRNALLDLLSEYEKSVYDTCKEDFRNRGKGKQINSCIHIESLKLLLSSNDAKFFDKTCNDKAFEKNKDACVAMMRGKLGDVYFKSEMELCVLDNGFNTTKSVVVCKDVMISKILAFSTEAEQLKLAQCLSEKGSILTEVKQAPMLDPSLGDEQPMLMAEDGRRKMVEKSVTVSKDNVEEINKCVGAFLHHENKFDEETYLTQIKDRFCGEKGKIEESKRDQCLQDLLIENFQDMSFNKECLKLPDQVAQKACQRISLYKKILENKDDGLFACWDRSKFPKMKDRQKCHDLSKESHKKISSCPKTPDDVYVTCLQKVSTSSIQGVNVGKEEAAIALQKFLKSKTVDTTFCDKSEDKMRCYNDLYAKYKQEEELKKQNELLASTKTVGGDLNSNPPGDKKGNLGTLGGIEDAINNKNSNVVSDNQAALNDALKKCDHQAEVSPLINQAREDARVACYNKAKLAAGGGTQGGEKGKGIIGGAIAGAIGGNGISGIFSGGNSENGKKDSSGGVLGGGSGGGGAMSGLGGEILAQAGGVAIGAATTAILNKAGVKVSPVMGMVFSGVGAILIKSISRAIKYRKSNHPSCKCIAKAGGLQTGVLIAQHVKTTKITKVLENVDKNGTQTKAIETVETFQNDQTSIYQDGEQYQKVVTNVGESCQGHATSETAYYAERGEPHPGCGGASSRVTNFNVIPKTKLFVAQIEQSQNSYHTDLIYEEWNNYMSGDVSSVSLEEIDLVELKKKDDKSNMKVALITAIKFFDLLIPSAHADNKENFLGIDGKTIVNVGLSLLTSDLKEQKSVQENLMSEPKSGTTGDNPIAVSQDIVSRSSKLGEENKTAAGDSKNRAAEYRNLREKLKAEGI